MDITEFKKMVGINIEKVIDDLQFQVKEYRKKQDLINEKYKNEDPECPERDLELEEVKPAYLKLVVNKKTAVVSIASNELHECYSLDVDEEGNYFAIAFISMDILDQYFTHFQYEFAGRDDCACHYYGNFKSFMSRLTGVIMEGMLATTMFGGNGKMEKVETL